MTVLAFAIRMQDRLDLDRFAQHRLIFLETHS
jgi:hypothetical protein